MTKIFFKKVENIINDVHHVHNEMGLDDGSG